MGQVVEIINAPNYTFIPRTKEWVLGLANIRGHMLPIYDIEKYFGSKLAGNRARHRVLVIESEHVYAGLMVSNVFGLKHFPVNSFKQPYQGKNDVFSNCIDSAGIDTSARIYGCSFTNQQSYRPFCGLIFFYK